jgi:hypothetical protein
VSADTSNGSPLGAASENAALHDMGAAIVVAMACLSCSDPPIRDIRMSLVRLAIQQLPDCRSETFKGERLRDQ